MKRSTRGYPRSGYALMSGRAHLAMHWQPCDNYRAITKPFAPRRSRKSDNDDSSRTAHTQQHNMWIDCLELAR
uniref:Uncharacterized protein n=1 Tax=Trichogramma kaykai TaxID=54128 RepID=A0ABD2WWN0_9HYME